MITDDVLDGAEAVTFDCDGTMVDRQKANAIALNYGRRPCRAQPRQTQ